MRTFMKEFSRTILLLLFIYSTQTAADLSDTGYIRSIESRQNGHHALYVSVVVPDVGCTYSDRMVIREESVGGSTMINMAMSAFIDNKRVNYLVEGCTALFPDLPQYTAPQITKIQVFSQ